MAKSTVSPPGLCAEHESLGFVEPPPGLAPPPGLTQASKPTEDVAAKPGEDDVDDGDFVLGGLKVLVTGLPNDLLSEPMVEAMLQQAGLSDGVVGFRVKLGKPCGKMAITVKDFLALDLVMNHFRGCIWDTSGEAVESILVSDVKEMAEQAAKEAFSATASGFNMGQLAADAVSVDEPLKVFPVAAADLGAMEHMAAEVFSAVAAPRLVHMDADAVFAAEAILAAEAPYATDAALAASFAPSSLSADAKVFTPSATTNHTFTADPPAFEPRNRDISKLSGLSSSAPIFVPGASFDGALRTSTPAGGKLATPVTTTRTPLRNSSETSTEVGDSDCEDTTAGLVVA